MKRRTRFLAIPLACLLSGCAASTSEHVNAEVERLEHEVLELRRQFALESATQMRQIGIYAALYAQSGADRFPEKPSELRALLDEHGQDWSIFISPAERTPELMGTLSKLEDPWAWIDANGSYEFKRGVPLYDGSAPLMVERTPSLPEARNILFGDVHTELVPIGSGS